MDRPVSGCFLACQERSDVGVLLQGCDGPEISALCLTQLARPGLVGQTQALPHRHSCRARHHDRLAAGSALSPFPLSHEPRHVQIHLPILYKAGLKLSDSPWIWAIENQKRKALVRCLNNGMSADSITSGLTPAIIVAARTVNLKLVATLLKRGDPNAQDVEG